MTQHDVTKGRSTFRERSVLGIDKVKGPCVRFSFRPTARGILAAVGRWWGECGQSMGD